MVLLLVCVMIPFKFEVKKKKREILAAMVNEIYSLPNLPNKFQA